MDLRRLTQNTGCRLLRGDALTEITSVCCDSRCAGPGALFVCLPGERADGHDYAPAAYQAGCRAFLAQRALDLPADAAQVLVPDSRSALAQVGAVAILCLEENKGKLALFGGIKNARFRKQVTPGDVLTLHCELVEQRGPVGVGKASAYVDGKCAATAELTFVLTDAQ